MLRMMPDNRSVELQVFIETGCEVCERAVSLAEDVEKDYPKVAVRVIDMNGADGHRDDVFAVPTFVLNGRVFSLGNPQQQTLQAAIESLLREQD